jgi:hypothetical protein
MYGSWLMQPSRGKREEVWVEKHVKKNTIHMQVVDKKKII